MLSDLQHNLAAALVGLANRIIPASDEWRAYRRECRQVDRDNAGPGGYRGAPKPPGASLPGGAFSMRGMTAEYTIQDESGQLAQWSCGCPRITEDVESALALLGELGAQDSVVRRYAHASPWVVIVGPVA